MIDDDPFAILGVPITATTREVEREAAKLLGMLALGVGDVGTYASPAGPRPRTPDAVRAAAARLRDPRQRLLAELVTGAPVAPASPTPPVDGWPDALRRTGWGPR
ncbi:MAG: hypothetical protein IPL61_11390 [Myxococcales bacterium]|nr:hypothetical protein [Myxococcales bacterium]